ncbi:hypothetical protein VNI00_008443 [Paramarasmius palmivorus]|uniref:Uncharacterized protein n=1 Tax=Paramarasmius palmivorus TaxID=297713 RepID=A0AAW0CVH8_9AGAR
MLSLHRISTSSDRLSPVGSMKMIMKEDGWAVMAREHELGDGLFVFITVLASRDIVPLFQKRQVMLVPKKEVSQFALELIRFNAIAVGKDDRRKFEATFQEFGSGPWEYILMPGKYDRKTREPCQLPPLFYHHPDGTVSTMTFDTTDLLSLPEVSSKIHPAIIAMHAFLHPPNVFNMPPSIKDDAVIPLIRIAGAWPLWQHNRFISSTPTSSKRKRSESETSSLITCLCSTCRVVETLSSSSSSVTCDDRHRPFAVDDEEAEEAEGKRRLGIVTWAGKVVLPAGTDDLDNLVELDPLLQEYAQESALDPDLAKQVQEEEDQKRLLLAAPTLDDVWCRVSVKRSRRN